MTEKNQNPLFVRCFRQLKRKVKHIIRRGNESPLKREMLEYYSTLDPKDLDDDIKDAIDYISRKGVFYYPFKYAEEYDYDILRAYIDTECNLPYVIQDEKRLYFPEGMSKKEVRYLYYLLLIERDKRSSHSYQNDSFKVEDGDILFDIGAAEGSLSLSVIEKVKKVYLFEMEERWLKPLVKTFEPWKDKVEIIRKYVSNEDTETTVKIDSVTGAISAGETIFFKLDVEGAESLVIEGAEETMSSRDFNVKAAICTYHKPNDFEELSSIMLNKNYKVERSNSYMLYLPDKLTPPYFRRGMIYCTNPDK